MNFNIKSLVLSAIGVVFMTAEYGIAEELTTSDWAIHTETTIDRPIKDVWPIFVDLKKWYREYSLEVIAGEPYRDGVGLREGQEIIVIPLYQLPIPESAPESSKSLRLLQTNIKVVPEKEIVLKLTPIDKGGAWGMVDFVSFYVWRLSENDNKTTITVDSYGEAQFAPVSELPSEPVNPPCPDKCPSNFDRSWGEAFKNLEALVLKQ